jgi:hypothetical protein
MLANSPRCVCISLKQKQVDYIMQEFNDSVQRAERLSVARENLLMGKNNRPDLVTQEDLAIYTRWLVCHLHALRTIHHFLQVVGPLVCRYTCPGEGEGEARCPDMRKHSPASTLSIWLSQENLSRSAWYSFSSCSLWCLRIQGLPFRHTAFPWQNVMRKSCQDACPGPCSKALAFAKK